VSFAEGSFEVYDNAIYWVTVLAAGT
jgi:hypothetical protein